MDTFPGPNSVCNNGGLTVLRQYLFPFRKNVKSGNEKKGKLKRENTGKGRKKLEHRFEHITNI